MLTIFSIKKTLEAQVASLTKEIETLKEANKSLEAKNNIGFTLEQYNALKSENEELGKQVEAMVKQLEESDSKMKEFEKRASEKALEIVQQTGAPQINVAEAPITNVDVNGGYKYKTHY